MGASKRDVGLRIREVRGEDSQEQAAIRCGMSQSQWSKLERGRFDKTSYLPAISLGYGVSVQWLHDGTGPKLMAKSVREAREREAIAQTWPDLAELVDRISPTQRQALASIAVVAAQGRLTDEDVELLAQTARALAARR